MRPPALEREQDLLSGCTWRTLPGARRFNPVRVTKVDVRALERDRDQAQAIGDERRHQGPLMEIPAVKTICDGPLVIRP